MGGKMAAVSATRKGADRRPESGERLRSIARVIARSEATKEPGGRVRAGWVASLRSQRRLTPNGVMPRSAAGVSRSTHHLAPARGVSARASRRRPRGRLLGMTQSGGLHRAPCRPLTPAPIPCLHVRLNQGAAACLRFLLYRRRHRRSGSDPYLRWWRMQGPSGPFFVGRTPAAIPRQARTRQVPPPGDRRTREARGRRRRRWARG